MISRILAQAFVLSPMLGLWLGLAPPPQPEPAPAAKPAGPAVEPASAEPPAAADERTSPIASAADVVDVVLPCGLRVITAKDASLPVASVVLSVEVGTRDDPDKLPGLVHALAYHLQQGNRELAPGEAIATAHDVGGIASMAVGTAQVRFESLVPISALDAQLRVESLRLRAPNSGRELWLKSLSYARADDGTKLLVPREAIAAVWQDPGLAHDGRQVSRALGDMLDQSVAAQLSRLFDYRLATLVVVGPDDPQALLARIEPLFKDLGSRPRKAVPTAQAPTQALGAAAPTIVRAPKQKGDSMLWAVSGDPRSRAWAQVLCGTLNRQPRRDDEPPKTRVRCTYEDDPRRPILLLRAVGFDPATGPEPLIAARLDRIAAIAADPNLEPDLAALLENQRERIEEDLRFALRTPLELATYLASAAERRGPAQAKPLTRDELLGLPQLPSELANGPADGPASGPAHGGAAVAEPASEPSSSDASPDDAAPVEQPPMVNAAAELITVIPGLLDTRRAVLLLDEDQPEPPSVHGPAAEPDAAPVKLPAKIIGEPEASTAEPAGGAQ